MTDIGSSSSNPSSPSTPPSPPRPPPSNARSSLPTTASSDTLTTSTANQPAMATSPHLHHHHEREVTAAEVAAAASPAPRPENPPSLDEPHSSSLSSASTTTTSTVTTANPSPNTNINTSTTPKPPRKRAHSIDTEEANQPRIQDLRLYTPSTAKSNTSSVGSEAPRELICLCTKAPKVPRPRNAFILYRQHYQGQVAARHPGLANPEISKLIGEQWREQPEDIKNNWKRLAEEEKIRHQRQYPDYRYQPRRGGKTANNRPLPATGEDPSHCPKCGGRYIATPRTPSTPFSAATPDFMRPGSSSMPPYVTPNPRVIETDHLRRGSTSSTMSLDGMDRRYPQSHLHHIDEDYAMMSPGPGSAEIKRRRFNGPNIFVPGSPPMGYMPVDPRFQQRPSVSNPPISATGYGPGALPRLATTQYHQHQHQPPPYSGHPHSSHAHPHMQPPPRPSISYQHTPTSTTRSNAAFDESLRLPPLQTQIPSSPAMGSSDPGTARGAPPSAQTPAHGTTGLGIVNGGSGPSRQQQQQQQQPPQMPPRWPFLLKLEVLRSISPPLKPPGAGQLGFETRGPLIAIEGAATSVLREVASVVEKALFGSHG